MDHIHPVQNSKHETNKKKEKKRLPWLIQSPRKRKPQLTCGYATGTPATKKEKEKVSKRKAETQISTGATNLKK